METRSTRGGLDREPGRVLLLVFGPPAVGKMTVGRAVADVSDFRLFHNHHLIEPLLDVFDYGSPPFARLLPELRQRVLEEAAAADVDLVFTLVWGLDLDHEVTLIRHHLAPFLEAGRPVAFVELYAGLDVRLERNRTAYRLAEKPSKRDVAWSDDNLRSMEEHQLSTGPPSVADALLAEHPYLRIDNTDRPATEVATEILRWLAH